MAQVDYVGKFKSFFSNFDLLSQYQLPIHHPLYDNKVFLERDKDQAESHQNCK